jgi:hypothetical protein
MQLVRHQRVEVNLPPPSAASPGPAEVILSRAQRAHARLSREERRARNARKKGEARSRSSCSGSQKALRPFWGWRQRNASVWMDSLHAPLTEIRLRMRAIGKWHEKSKQGRFLSSFEGILCLSRQSNTTETGKQRRRR